MRLKRSVFMEKKCQEDWIMKAFEVRRRGRGREDARERGEE